LAALEVGILLGQAAVGLERVVEVERPGIVAAEMLIEMSVYAGERKTTLNFHHHHHHHKEDL